MDDGFLMGFTFKDYYKKVYQTGFFTVSSGKLTGMAITPTYIDPPKTMTKDLYDEFSNKYLALGTTFSANKYAISDLTDDIIDNYFSSYIELFEEYKEYLLYFIFPNKAHLVTFYYYDSSSVYGGRTYELSPVFYRENYYDFVQIASSSYGYSSKMLPLVFFQVEGVSTSTKPRFFFGPLSSTTTCLPFSANPLNMSLYCICEGADGTYVGSIEFTSLMTSNIPSSTSQYFLEEYDFPWNTSDYTQYSWVSRGTSTGYRHRYLGTMTITDDPPTRFHILIGQASTNAGGSSGGGSTSTVGGGNGDYDDSSDVIEIPDVPNSVIMTATGLISMYAPTYQQLYDLADYLWTDFFNVTDNLKKIIADPIDFIISIGLVPFTVNSGSPKSAKIGYVDSGVTMNLVASQYQQIDCGTIDVNEYWGNALDYAPYTKISIFLPFVGYVTLNTDEAMNSTITVKYNVDLFSGACVAFVKITKYDSDNNVILDSVLYQFSGTCTTQIPITSGDFSNFYSSILKIAGTALVAEAMPPMTMTTNNDKTKSPVNINSTINTRMTDRGIVDSAVGMIGMKPNVARSSGGSANNSILGTLRPYLTIERPIQSLAEDYNKFNGYPTNITYTLSELSGFTVVDSTHVENITATESEKAMIESLLKSGVIL